MRFGIVCIDTRGGAQPYLALALGLMRAGHAVRVIAPQNFASFFQLRGVDFASIPGDVQAVLEDPTNAGVAEKGFIASHRFMIRLMSESIAGWTKACLEHCADVDAMVAGFGGMLVAEGVAEKLGVPFVQAHLQPLTPTAEFPGLLSFPGLPNRWSHALTRQLFWLPLRAAVNRSRREVLGLRPLPITGHIGRAGPQNRPILYAFSPSLIPRPADWAPSIHVTGYWFLDAQREWTPPPALVDFLAAGPAPIAVGFGSMSSRDAQATTELIVEALERSNQRAVLIAGWGGMKSSAASGRAFVIDSAPHDWLFPRMTLAVHHGGAGTTGAALRAGVPSIIVPFAADQPFWGSVIARRGLGPRPIPRARLTPARLAEAITQVVGDAAMRRAAAAMGERVRAEDGVGRAVEILSKLQSPAHTKTVTTP